MNSLFLSRSHESRQSAVRWISGAALVGAVALSAGFLQVATTVPAAALTNTNYAVTSNADAAGVCPSPTNCTLSTAITDYNAQASGGTATITFSGTFPASTITHEQTSTSVANTASGGTNAAVFGSTPSPGDTIVVNLMLQATGTVSSVSGLGATWTPRGTNNFSTYTDVSYSGVVGASPTNSLTVTTSGPSWYLGADEFAGVDSASGFVAASGTTTPGSITLHPSAKQGVDVWGNSTGVSGSPPSSPWVDASLLGGNIFGAYQIAAASGPVTASWSLTTGSPIWGLNGVLLSPTTVNTYLIAATGLPVIHNPNGVPLTITGNGAANTIIDGGGSSNNLTVSGGAPVTITGLTVQNVTSGYGGIQNTLGGNLTLSQVTLTANNGGGGILNWNGSILTASGITVTANTGTAPGGGGIQNYATLNMSNSTVSNNTEAGEGGGIYNTTPGVLLLTNDLITQNTAATGGAPGLGGGIYNGGGAITASQVTLSNNTAKGTLLSPSSDGLGGGIYTAGGRVNLSSDTISGNTATGTGNGNGFGGGIYAAGTIVSANGVSVSGNTAAGDTTVSPVGVGGIGGGIYSNPTPSFNFINGSVSGNVANGVGAAGGGIYANGGRFIATNDTVSGNKATGTGAVGGGIFLDTTASPVGLTFVTVSSNTASGSGGGIYVAGGSLTLNESLVTLNTAGLNGGGIDVAGGTVTVNSTTISHNTATAGNGGGIYLSGGNLYLLSDLITANKAVLGGGIFVAGGTLHLFPSTTVTGNTPNP